LQITHHNPGAKNPLILPIHVICNTDDNQIHENIMINSRFTNNWQKLIPEHNKIAVLCGSGPSIVDSIDEIKTLQENGAVVFAMNGAANFLNDHGILADYQCIIDARDSTADLIGEAKEHLFASQVSHLCFEKVPDAILYHLQIEGIDNFLPEYNDSYCLIGGAASVGNTATCLAYAMGYRNMQIFGYDSSNKGESSHAFHQVMNDGEPMASVRFGGKDYLCSLTMKLQAEKFMETARSLIAYGVKIEVHGYGLLPDMWNAWGNIKNLNEQDKYELMWTHPEYREVAPGENCASIFIDRFNPKGKVIDFGCGTGRGALKLKEHGCEMLLLDFTENSRDIEALSMPFKRADLTLPIDVDAVEYGYCTDVMEHIEPENVSTVILNIMDKCDKCFFQISTVPDVMGSLIGQDLHLTVKPLEWWKSMFIDLSFTVEWEENQNIAALFYVTKA
jgi:SAM-dependent methyltransferase